MQNIVRAGSARAALLVVLAALAASNLAAAELPWSLVTANCSPSPDGFSVACGNYGTLIFDDQTGLGCPVLNSGSETPQVYPRPGDMTAQLEPNSPVSTLARVPGPRSLGARAQLPSSTASDPGSEPGIPCFEGVCFGPPGGASGGEPWISLVDWDDWHGWTAGWTAKSISDLAVSLYPVDAPELVGALGTAIGDAHILAALCQLTDDVDSGRAVPPLALNMSFGRLLKQAEEEAGSTCNSGALSCQIRRVLDHLTGLGIASVAAAGNHGQLLFPASYGPVLATGSLDLAAFRWSGLAQGAWEAPLESEALFPGYGICLEYSTQSGGLALWPAPAGSSYASAIFSGWLASALDTGGLTHPLGASFIPTWFEREQCYKLSTGDDGTCNGKANALLGRALGRQGLFCWSGTLQDPHLLVQGPTPPLTDLGVPSLDEWVDTNHSPAPEADPCVPCVTGGGDSMEGGSFTAKGHNADDLTIDLSASGPLGENHRLDGLYLRVGENFHPLLETNAGDGTELQSVTDGTYKSLVLRGFTSLFDPNSDQTSLVHVLCDEGLSQGACFWTSTPILIVAAPELTTM